MVQTKRAAIYARISTDDQKCRRQIDDLQAFAKRAGYEILGVVCETASGAKENREERSKLIGMARRREIDAILVTELTRWSRSTQDLLSTMQQLSAWGVSIVAQTGLDLDLTTPQGKLFATIMAGLGEFERDVIRQRVKSGLAAAKNRGQKLGRQQGDNPSAKHEKAVADHLKAKRSVRWIAAELHISKTTVIAIKKRIAS